MGRSANWQSVSNWKDVGWDTYYERTNPGPFLGFGTNVTAESDYVTMYIRAWKKVGRRQRGDRHQPGFDFAHGTQPVLSAARAAHLSAG